MVRFGTLVSLRQAIGDAFLLAWLWVTADCQHARPRRQAGMTIMEYVLMATVVIGVFGFFMFHTFAPAILASMTGMLHSTTSIFTQGCAASNGSC